MLDRGAPPMPDRLAAAARRRAAPAAPARPRRLRGARAARSTGAFLDALRRIVPRRAGAARRADVGADDRGRAPTANAVEARGPPSTVRCCRPRPRRSRPKRARRAGRASRRGGKSPLSTRPEASANKSQAAVPQWPIDPPAPAARAPGRPPPSPHRVRATVAASGALAPSRRRRLASAAGDAQACALRGRPAAAALPDPIAARGVTLHYQVRRGFLRGDGEIRWQPSGDGYRLVLEARVAGVTLLMQTSEGGVDANGLAPVRFVDQRARRSAQAANFRRDAGTITFSGSGAEWPLLAGSQDRLSWMIQLAGIAAAEPQLLAEGGRITMVVVGARGDAERLDPSLRRPRKRRHRPRPGRGRSSCARRTLGVRHQRRDLARPRALLPAGPRDLAQQLGRVRVRPAARAIDPAP